MSLSIISLLHSMNVQQQLDEDERILILSLLHDQIRNRYYHTRIHQTIPVHANSAWDSLRESQNDAAFIVTCGLNVTAFNKLYTSYKHYVSWYVLSYILCVYNYICTCIACM